MLMVGKEKTWRPLLYLNLKAYIRKAFRGKKKKKEDKHNLSPRRIALKLENGTMATNVFGVMAGVLRYKWVHFIFQCLPFICNGSGCMFANARGENHILNYTQIGVILLNFFFSKGEWPGIPGLRWTRDKNIWRSKCNHIPEITKLGL